MNKHEGHDIRVYRSVEEEWQVIDGVESEDPETADCIELSIECKTCGDPLDEVASLERDPVTNTNRLVWDDNTETEQPA